MSMSSDPCSWDHVLDSKFTDMSLSPHLAKNSPPMNKDMNTRMDTDVDIDSDMVWT